MPIASRAILRLGVVRDFAEEQWPSMDLCADQLTTHLHERTTVVPTILEPRFRRRFQRLPILGRRQVAFNADRLYNRHLVLPRYLRHQHGTFDCFHVVDHSYAHAVLALPPGRTGVYCHDLDAFRSLLEPEKEPRPWWFRKLARRTLAGLQAAAVVFHNSRQVGQQLVEFGLAPANKLVHAPLGVAAEFVPAATPALAQCFPGLEVNPYLLHVGSHLRRKRIDVLLDVFAALRQQFPLLRLVQVGGPWPTQHSAQLERLNLGSHVVKLQGLTREALAVLYRNAAAVLVPSEAEGFGLPVIEALACGATVMASDLPVLREVGGDAVMYGPVAEVQAWARTIARILVDRRSAPTLEVRLAQAARYSWREHVRVIVETYLRLME